MKTKKESMTEKVSHSGYNEKKEPVSMFGGMVALFLGLILLIVGVVFLVLFNLPARLDENMKAPIVDTLSSHSNEKSILVKGVADEGSKVVLYVNSVEYKKMGEVDKDKRFEVEYIIEKEGDYVVEVAAISGFPVRYRSPKSSIQTVVIDWTAPSRDVKFTTSRESEVNRVVIKGDAEKDTTITMRNRNDNNKEYKTGVNSEGKFEIKDVYLINGDNSFVVEIQDRAGNKAVLSSDYVVNYSKVNGGSVNGGGAVDLPESSGEIANFIKEMFAQRLVVILGVLSLIVLAVNSAIVLTKLRRESI